ncbi:hypothetical protein M3Y95_00824600 [Aphelenchoides besseyi]|nr:hypothetical protein M3Y95_00824600 [Aphelenchoides besseyi]
MNQQWNPQSNEQSNYQAQYQPQYPSENTQSYPTAPTVDLVQLVRQQHEQNFLAHSTLQREIAALRYETQRARQETNELLKMTGKVVEEVAMLRVALAMIESTVIRSDCDGPVDYKFISESKVAELSHRTNEIHTFARLVSHEIFDHNDKCVLMNQRPEPKQLELKRIVFHKFPRPLFEQATFWREFSKRINSNIHHYRRNNRFRKTNENDQCDSTCTLEQRTEWSPQEQQQPLNLESDYIPVTETTASASWFVNNETDEYAEREWAEL